MVTSATTTNLAPTLADLRHIERAFRRAELLRRYSQGTFKRSAMAMINQYMRLTAHVSKSSNDLHPAM